MAESASPQEPPAHFHKRIPSIFGRLTAFKGQPFPTVEPAPEGSAPPPGRLRRRWSTNPMRVLIVFIVAGTAMAGSAATAFVVWKVRTAAAQQLQEQKQMVASYRKALLELQQEVQGKVEATTDVAKLQQVLTEVQEQARKFQEELEAQRRATEESGRKEHAFMEEIRQLQQRLQESETLKGLLQNQLAQLQWEDRQLGKQRQATSDRERSIVKARLLVVKPQARIGVIDLGSRDGITPDMVLGIYDEQGRKVGEFLVDEPEDFLAAGRIRADDLKKIKPGARVWSAEPSAG